MFDTLMVFLEKKMKMLNKNYQMREKKSYWQMAGRQGRRKAGRDRQIENKTFDCLYA